jgi:hypothetical protein
MAFIMRLPGLLFRPTRSELSPTHSSLLILGSFARQFADGKTGVAETKAASV